MKIFFFRVFEYLQVGLRFHDQDVYDGVAWSVVGPLSKISVENGSMPVPFPDFTRGKWKQKRKLGVIES